MNWPIHRGGDELGKGDVRGNTGEVFPEKLVVDAPDLIPPRREVQPYREIPLEELLGHVGQKGMGVVIVLRAVAESSTHGGQLSSVLQPEGETVPGLLIPMLGEAVLTTSTEAQLWMSARY